MSKTVLSAKLAKTLNNVNIIMGVGDIILTIELLNRKLIVTFSLKLNALVKLIRALSGLSNEAMTESENASNITDEILRSTSALLQQSWKHLWNCINKQKKVNYFNLLVSK